MLDVIGAATQHNTRGEGRPPQTPRGGLQEEPAQPSPSRWPGRLAGSAREGVWATSTMVVVGGRGHVRGDHAGRGSSLTFQLQRRAGCLSLERDGGIKRPRQVRPGKADGAGVVRLSSSSSRR